MSYTSIGSVRSGIREETLYFVPLGENLEVWRAAGDATSATAPAELSVFSSVEFCLWDALDDMTNFQRNFNVGEVEVVDGVIYHKTEYRERRNHFAYFACSEPLAGFDTQRDAFLGAYRGWDTPGRRRAGQLPRLRRARLGADRLAPRPAVAGSRVRRREVVFLLGYAENPPDAKFDPPGIPDDQQAGGPADDRALAEAGKRSRRASRRLRALLGRACSA